MAKFDQITEEEIRFLREYISNGRNAAAAWRTFHPDATASECAKAGFKTLSRRRVIAELERLEMEASDALRAAVRQGDRIGAVSEEISALVVPQVLRVSAEKLAAMRAYIAERASKDALIFQMLRLAEKQFDAEPGIALRALELVARIQGLIVERRRVNITDLRDLPDDEVNTRLRALLAAMTVDAEDAKAETIQ